MGLKLEMLKINFLILITYKELIVDIIIENDVSFPKTSYAELYETGLIRIPSYCNNT